PGIIEGMDREMLLELRNDFLEYVELGSERMQENEVRADPSSDAADSHAAEIHILHRNPGGPDQCFGPLRGRPQGFEDVGKYDHRDEDCQDGNQYPGHAHGAIPSGLGGLPPAVPLGEPDGGTHPDAGLFAVRPLSGDAVEAGGERYPVAYRDA